MAASAAQQEAPPLSKRAMRLIEAELAKVPTYRPDSKDPRDIINAIGFRESTTRFVLRRISLKEANLARLAQEQEENK